MQELKINVENGTIEEAFKSFILNYRTNIADFMNQLVNNDGSPCDSDIKEVDGVLTVYHIAPDKGFVLGEVSDQDVPFQVMQYSELGNDLRYILPERDKLSVLLKQPIGTVDIRLGAFKSLADAVAGWNSEAVKNKLAEAAQYKKAKQKDIDRLKRLGKLQENDAQEVEPIEESND